MSATRPLRVHVVEDNDAIAELLCYALESRGYEVTRASSSWAALAHNGEWDGVDVAIVDLWLDDDRVTGAEILGHLKEHRPKIRRVVYTASGVPDDPVRSLADDVVVKGENVERLVAAIEGGHV